MFSTVHITTLSLYLTYFHSQPALRLSLKYTGLSFLIKPWLCFSISSNAEDQSSRTHSLNPVAEVGSEFDFVWSRVSTRMTKYNSIRLNPVTKRLVYPRVNIRSAPSLRFAKTIIISSHSALSLLSPLSALLPEEYVNMVLSSSSLTTCEILHIDFRLTSTFLRITLKILHDLFFTYRLIYKDFPNSFRQS